ncbi:Crp/Fnr family transcriptional regulator [Photobacterium sanguinicancri]|uniref:Transcriptional regulator n=1 Tax=Photobacterium sanguinicancri TaxID=875932 RepID=A0ABX4FX16_9GAMM|nr:Crp/Fnr family transcriptional regulator [Photobacterium sanguinicancri]OZS43424.1 transcriptional regulator [Photobacterium sanguinicancri]
MPDSIISLLNEDGKKQLFSECRRVHFNAGDQLFNQGEEAKSMYLVSKGKVSLFRLMPNGDEKLFKVFMAGELIAEMAMFMNPRVYPMSARVEQDTELFSFDYANTLRIFTCTPEVSVRVMTYMSNRIYHLMDTVNILTQVNANQRLVMRLAEIYRLQQKQDRRVLIPVTKKLLATQLGMTPETLSRSIKKLKTEGFISESGNHIVLLDIPALCEFVDLTPDIFSLQ